MAEEVDVDVSGLVDETGSGGDAALGPDRDTASAQDAALVPDRDTGSAQDAAPNPNRDTASGQDEPEIEPGSSHGGSASGQKRVRCTALSARNTRRRINDSDPVAAGVEVPHRMPRGAFFQRVIMPWILDPRDIDRERAPDQP